MIFFVAANYQIHYELVFDTSIQIVKSISVNFFKLIIDCLYLVKEQLVGKC